MTCGVRPSRSGRTGVGSARLVLVLLCLVAVVAIVIAGLWFAGWLPGSGSSAGSNAVPYSAAVTAALAASASFHGGGWSLFQAVGISVPAAATYQVPTFGPSCPFQMAPGQMGMNISIAAHDDPGTGTTPGWEMFLRNASGGFAMAVVANGVARMAGTAAGSNCQFYGAYRSMPGGIIDSPSAVSAVNVAGGSEFLKSHASVSAVIVVTGGLNYRVFPSPPENATWVVMYSSCGTGPSMMSSGQAFVGWVNATSGAVLNTTTVSGACGDGTTGPSMPAGNYLLAQPVGVPAALRAPD